MRDRLVASSAEMAKRQWERAGTHGCLQGELHTYVDTISGASIESDSLAQSGRFAIDPDSLFLFSSQNPAMMNGLKIRTLRVEAKFSTQEGGVCGTD